MLRNPSRVEVSVDRNTQRLNTQQHAAVFMAWCFNDNGNLRRDCAQFDDRMSLLSQSNSANQPGIGAAHAAFHDGPGWMQPMTTVVTRSHQGQPQDLRYAFTTTSKTGLWPIRSRCLVAGTLGRRVCSRFVLTRAFYGRSLSLSPGILDERPVHECHPCRRRCGVMDFSGVTSKAHYGVCAPSVIRSVNAMR